MMMLRSVSSSLARRRQGSRVVVGRVARHRTPHHQSRRPVVTKTSHPETVFQKIAKRPIEYATIPCVAAFVGIATNWMGVKVRKSVSMPVF